MNLWQVLGSYEFEVDENAYTGWYRCANGRTAQSGWPEWNSRTGAMRMR